MAPHSSTLAWKIPWMEEPVGLQSMGSLSQTGLSDFTSTFHFHAGEKVMATHSSVLAWRILAMGEPGGLLSMGLHRVGHDWSDLAAAAAAEVLYQVPRCLLEIFIKLHLTQDFPGGSVVKNLPANAGDARDMGLIPGSGRSPDRVMATHSSILAWEIPWTEEPGGLQIPRIAKSQTNWAAESTCKRTHKHTHTHAHTHTHTPLNTERNHKDINITWCNCEPNWKYFYIQWPSQIATS